MVTYYRYLFVFAWSYDDDALMISLKAQLLQQLDVFTALNSKIQLLNNITYIYRIDVSNEH